MDKEIYSLFESVLKEATKEDKQVLKHVLEGLKNKQKHKRGTYLRSLFHIDYELENGVITRGTLPVHLLTENSLGILHGGITFTLLDSVMGTYANQLLPDHLGAVTSNLSIHYIAPVSNGSISATAQLLHHGKKTMVLEGKVVDSSNQLIAHGTGTFFIITKK
jgi:uncharacterized protein (TIGR00369 family)